MQQKSILTFLVILALSTLACGINITLPEAAIETGPTITEEIEVEYPESDEATDLRMNFGAGELIISPGEDDMLVSGIATYNVEEFEPQIKIEDNKVEINQGDLDYEFTGIPNFEDIKNEWALELGSEPLELEINAGAYEGNIELGGLALESLKIFSGASQLFLSFSEPNAAEMRTLRLTTGASEVEVMGLANANFNYLDFQGGVGNYELDFSGELQQDATVDISAGLSNMTIYIPEGVPATIIVEGGLTNIHRHGGWRQSGNTYSQDGEGYELTINIDLGAGNLELEN